MTTQPTGPESASPPPVLQCPMVGWYQPIQLVRTGSAVLIATIFGRHADHRLIEALGTDPLPIYDYTCHYQDDGQARCTPDPSRPRQELWLDYVADVGDGWHPTYAIAYYMAQPELRVATHATDGDATVITRRGELLIFGGDEVYPTPGREAYERRLLGPYATALRATTAPYPHVFAVPGNHDWYDSLAAFIRLFASRRWFAGWRTRQHRSYFALRLPHQWWLLGTDVQLGSDIDRPQMAYFEGVAAQIQALDPGARIILCHAEPHWVYQQMYRELDATYSESNLALLEKRLGQEVAVFLAGDQHHYRRYEAADGSGTQKITAGGGGAFLHPTHTGLWGTDVGTLQEDPADWHGVRPAKAFRQRACFPTTEESARLCWRNLIFPYLPHNASRTFGLVTAILYWLSTLPFLAEIDTFPFQAAGRALPPCPDCGMAARLIGWALAAMLGHPLTWAWVLVMGLGFVLLTDTHSRWYRGIAGPLHALAHLAAAWAIACGALALVLAWTTPAWIWPIPVAGYVFALDWRLVLTSGLIALGGFVGGSFIMGLYLLVSLNLFGRHWNEAFSSLAIPDWKHFLRLHIAPNGDLTIYPIGLERVPRRWRRRTTPYGPELEPDDPNATEPMLLERPIVVEGAAAAATRGTRMPPHASRATGMPA
jgi:Calcineurin-like phosphoesterase